MLSQQLRNNLQSERSGKFKVTFFTEMIVANHLWDQKCQVIGLWDCLLLFRWLYFAVWDCSWENKKGIRTFV